MHQADTGGQSDQLGPIVQAELSIDPVEVGVDRLAGETQLAGDFGRGAAICRQRVATTPSMPGMAMSISTMSGLAVSMTWRPARAVRASPTTA